MLTCTALESASTVAGSQKFKVALHVHSVMTVGRTCFSVVFLERANPMAKRNSFLTRNTQIRLRLLITGGFAVPIP